VQRRDWPAGIRRGEGSHVKEALVQLETDSELPGMDMRAWSIGI
jgi:hypothetical protein